MGDLVRSIEVRATGLSATVGSILKLAHWLEFGTRIMAARPWLKRTLDEMRPTITKMVTRAIRRATAKATR